MALDELEIVRLRNDFYRDGFNKIIIAFMMIVLAILLLISVSMYLISEKPVPIRFYTDNDFRAFPLVPIDQAYINKADLLQWTTDVLPSAFTFDFLNYKNELSNLTQYFTADGWKKLTDLLNVYANEKVIQDARMFMTAVPAGAPFVLNQGLLLGRYGWWIQMPLNIGYLGTDKQSNDTIVLQALVVRVPTLNDLSGIAIDNIVVSKNQGGESASG